MLFIKNVRDAKPHIDFPVYFPIRQSLLQLNLRRLINAVVELLGHPSKGSRLAHR